MKTRREGREKHWSIMAEYSMMSGRGCKGMGFSPAIIKSVFLVFFPSASLSIALS